MADMILTFITPSSAHEIILGQFGCRSQPLDFNELNVIIDRLDVLQKDCEDINEQ
jgi:hypothetical protein